MVVVSVVCKTNHSKTNCPSHDHGEPKLVDKLPKKTSNQEPVDRQRDNRSSTPGSRAQQRPSLPSERVEPTPPVSQSFSGVIAEPPVFNRSATPAVDADPSWRPEIGANSASKLVSPPQESNDFKPPTETLAPAIGSTGNSFSGAAKNEGASRLPQPPTMKSASENSNTESSPSQQVDSSVGENEANPAGSSPSSQAVVNPDTPSTELTPDPESSNANQSSVNVAKPNAPQLPLSVPTGQNASQASKTPNPKFETFRLEDLFPQSPSTSLPESTRPDLPQAPVANENIDWGPPINVTSQNKNSKKSNSAKPPRNSPNRPSIDAPPPLVPPPRFQRASTQFTTSSYS